MSVILRGKKTLLQRALAILRRPDITAHAYIAGASGAAVSGLLTNNYTLSNGSTGYSAVDGSAGLVLDGMGALGSELNPSLNFTGWTPQADWTINSGVASYSGTGGTNVLLNLGLAAGKTYLLTIDATVSSGSFKLLCGFDTASSTFTTSGQKSSILIRGTNAFVYVAAVGTSVLSFSSISVKEYTGTHLTQATTANKPLVRRGMYNLLTYSSTLTNAAWSKIGATTAPSATTISFPNTSEAFFNAVTIAAPAGSKWTGAFLLSGTGTTTILVARYMGGEYEVASLQVTLTATPTLYAVTLTLAAAQTAMLTGVSRVPGNTATTVTCDGGLLVQGLFTAAQILAEGGIPTTTATAASNPSAGKYWWSFDGSNDSLALGSVPFQHADDYSIHIAAMLTTAGANRTLLSVTNVSGHRGPWLRYDSTGKVIAQIFDGVASVQVESTLAYLNTAIVIRCRKVGNTLTLWINGVQVATDSHLALTLATLTSALVGAFDGGELLFAGSMNGVLAIKGTETDADGLQIDRLLAQQAGITI